jgi:uncharacterized protein YyaL (SSP411 family)
MYDQIGGGFHRYSVDNLWLVPHFEKMLYDNALLARAYLHAFQIADAWFYRRIVEETLDWVSRDMRDPSGGFYSTLDADSEGEEGKYYVWTPGEIEAVVGPDDVGILNRYYRVTEAGNFEGKNILTAPLNAEAVARELGVDLERLADAVVNGQTRLREARVGRVPPARDDKVLASWNGFMLRTYAEAARVLERPVDREVAEANAAFLLREMWRDGRMRRVYKDGEAKIDGFLDDYAAVADGLLALYQATFEPRWYEAAREIADCMLDLFWDADAHVFFDAPRDAEALVARPRDTWDNATPSGTSLATHVLLRLWALTGESRYEEIARTVFESMGELMAQHAVGIGNLLDALELYLAPPREVAIVGDPVAAETRQLIAVLNHGYQPDVVAALAAPSDEAALRAIPLLRDRPLVNGQPAAYVCRQFTCELPTSDPLTLARQLSGDRP